VWLSGAAEGWRDACASRLAGGVTLGGVRLSHLLAPVYLHTDYRSKANRIALVTWAIRAGVIVVMAAPTFPLETV
jgi:hypothetical protein